MNCNPPREIDARKPAALPVEKARILKRRRLNMGDSVQVSMMKNAVRKTTPTTKQASTFGEVQPIEWEP